MAQTAGPTVVFMFPAGAQRGQTIEATVVGNKLAGSDGVWVSGAGVTGSVVSVQSLKAKKPSKGGKSPSEPRPWTNADDATEAVKISLALAPDATAGLRDLRLLGPEGLSTRCRFLVDDLPDRTVTEPNSTPATAVALDKLPVAVNGQLYSGWTGPVGSPDRALFRFRAKAGETVVCDLRGRSLVPYINQAVPGWLDACLTLYDASGKRLAYADDEEFGPDPALCYKVDKDGDYMLEVRDVLHRSSQEFVYRLRVGTIPFLKAVYPLGGRRGAEAKVALLGANLGVPSLAVTPPPGGPDVQWISVAAAGATSNPRAFAAGALPESEEKEPNPDAAQATRVAVPGTVNGRIGQPGDEDVFVFRAEAGQRLVLEVEARRLGSPLDSALAVTDAAGDKVAANDDFSPPQAVPAIAETDTSATVDPGDALLTHQADSRICHLFPKAGDYFVRVRDVRDHGGETFGYRLTIAPETPDFELRVAPDTVRLARGDSALFAVSAFRGNDFKEEIAIEAGGLPAGFVSSRGVIPSGQTQGVITVTAPADAAPGVVCPTITGVVEAGGNRIARKAFPVETVVQAFYIKHQVPVEACVVRVEEGGGFTLAADLPPGQALEIPQNGSLQVPLRVVREGTNSAAIAISLNPKSQDVTMRPLAIPAGTNEVIVALSAGKQFAAGQQRSVAVTGILRDGKSAWTRTTPAITLRVGAPAKAPPKAAAAQEQKAPKAASGS